MADDFTINRIRPEDFSSIINDIDYQKSFLFRIALNNLTFSLPQREAFTITPLKEFELCTSSTSIPSATTNIQSVSFYNSELKIAKNTTFSEWSATFKLDSIYKAFNSNLSSVGKMNTYEYFYTWQNLVFDPIYRCSLLPYVYKKPIELYLLANDTTETTHFVLEGAFPTSISGGNLDYSADGLFTFNVNFAYDRFTVPSLDAYTKKVGT